VTATDQTFSSLPKGKQTFKGSCHCGAVRYEADLDLGSGSTRCNCTFCAKLGAWMAQVQVGDFRLLSGAEQLFDAHPNNPMVEGTTCRSCGIMAFGHGNVPEMGGEYYQVNVRCLDGVDVTGMSVLHLDGLHDTWAPLGTTVAAPPVPGARPE